MERARIALWLATFTVLAFAVRAPAAEDSAVVLPDAITWKPLSRAQTVGGPTMEVLWGDPLKGKGGFLLKLPGDGELPLRTQGADYTVVVVSGSWQHGGADGDLVTVPPGGYYKQRAKKQHRDKCLAGPDCVVVINTAGKFDLKPVKQDASGEVKPQSGEKKQK